MANWSSHCCRPLVVTVVGTHCRYPLSAPVVGTRCRQPLLALVDSDFHKVSRIASEGRVVGYPPMLQESLDSKIAPQLKFANTRMCSRHKHGFTGSQSEIKLPAKGLSYFEIETQLLTTWKDMVVHETIYHIVLWFRLENIKDVGRFRSQIFG